MEEQVIIEEGGLQTEFTPPASCRFYRNPQGFLGLEIGGKDYPRVQLSRSLPLTAPEEYLCVTDMKDNEIAVLERLTACSEEQQALLREELALRYFCPEVTQVKSIKEKMGSFYFDLSIGGFDKTVAVKDISKNLKQLSEKEIIITDADGNRYRITDVGKLQRKALRMIEPYLY
jgi:hypothetical protein